MSESSSNGHLRTSSVDLVRSSHPWTTADSAAGFVLRYLSPMRHQLTRILGTETEADEALKLLITHLVSAGFGEHKKGRLRDFLVKGIRSAAKTRVSNLPEGSRPDLNLESSKEESTHWLRFWRDGLLERAWRSLERYEHGSDDSPLYSILLCATAHPKDGYQDLAARVNEEAGLNLNEAKIRELLPVARAMFAQLIADEVAETLDSPSAADVQQEITTLGLTSAFSGIEMESS